MFMPAIHGQASDDQQKELLPKCNSLQIIGTYAQTELGHGTFVRVRSSHPCINQHACCHFSRAYRAYHQLPKPTCVATPMNTSSTTA